MSPNQHEAVEMVSVFSLDNGLEDSVRRLHDHLQCENTVVTLGDNGECGFDGTSYSHGPVHKVKAVDSVGCGDTVRAGMTMDYALDFNLRDCAKLGNSCCRSNRSKTVNSVAVEGRTFGICARQSFEDICRNT